VAVHINKYIGAWICGVSTIISSFAKSLAFLIVFYGFFFGIGIGVRRDDGRRDDDGR